MANANHDNVNELITKYLAGEASAEEEKRLLAWIQQNENNRKHYNSFRNAFDLATQHVGIPVSENLNIDVEKEWARFSDSIDSKKTRQLSPVQLWLRVAASLLLILATGAILYYYTQLRPTVFQTAANTQEVTLPDGSRVTLNRHTTLSYGSGFGDKSREIDLEGEAFFEVQPDAARPFVILTESAKVQVVGTSFNLNAYDSLSSVEVIVQTGIVSLEALKGDARLQLQAGQKGIYSKTRDQLSAVPNVDANFLSWTTKRLVFTNSDLPTVLRTLEKTYHATITYRVDIPASCIVTVTFDQQSLESVMRVLENTLGLKFTISGNHVEIIEAGC